MNSQDLDRLRAQIVLAADAAAKAMQPLVDARQELLVSLEPMLQAQKRMADAFAPTIRAAQLTQKRLAEALAPMLRQYDEMQATLAPFFDRLTQAFEHLPPRQRQALGVLANDGWYLDPDLGFAALFDIAHLFEVGELDGARAALITHFDSRLDSIEEKLVGRFPERATLIKAAMRAHRNSDYALSIPVLLAQADGICVQLVGVQLYARRDGKPLIAAHLSLEERTPFMASLLYPLTAPMPISAGASERASQGDLLNRHAVLHGESTDYDTHANSCRALSLLAYASWVLDKL